MTVTGPPDDYTDHLKTAAHEALSITDIVERLRGIAVPITHQAADEIERLRAVSAELCNVMEAHWLACSAEYARLAQLYLQYADDAQKTRSALEPKP